MTHAFRLPTLALSSIACLAWLATPAFAHFVWIDVVPRQQPPAVLVTFNEVPEPGDAGLIGKIAGTSAWTRGADGQTTDLALASPTGEDAAAALSAKPPVGTTQIEAQCDYGVYTRAPGGVRLHYFAKCVPAGFLAAPSDRLRLDVSAEPRDGKLALAVRFDGRPDGSSELLALDAQGETQPIKLDDNGRAIVERPVGGRLALRARRVAPQESGQFKGQAYAQTWYCSTLVVAGGEQSAADALTQARAGRALWNDFPGFSADVTVHADDNNFETQATIDAAGVVTLAGEKSPLHDWAEAQLESLVQHRMPQGEVVTGNVTFVAESAEHPLGRLIDLGDPGMQSRYRLKDGVIREVNRLAGQSRFTISVLSTELNDEGKYLPQAFTMTFWKVANGELQRSLGYWNQWQRVGGFDLPQRILEVESGPAANKTKELTLRNWRLLDRQATAASGR